MYLLIYKVQMVFLHCVIDYELKCLELLNLQAFSVSNKLT